MTNTERIAALEAEIAAAQAAIDQASLVAATASTSAADRLDRARAIVEQRELLKLTRLELAEARRAAAAETADAKRAERVAARERLCEAADEMERHAASMTKALRRAGNAYAAMQDSARAALSYGANAADFDLATYRTTDPIGVPYRFAIHAIADAFRFGPKDALAHWPRADRTQAGMTQALAPLLHARDSWRNPQEVEPATVTEWVEATPEEIADAL